jgi:hypothetical protein
MAMIMASVPTPTITATKMPITLITSILRNQHTITLMLMAKSTNVITTILEIT